MLGYAKFHVEFSEKKGVTFFPIKFMEPLNYKLLS